MSEALVTDIEYTQRVDCGVHELCDLAQGMDIDAAENFFQNVARTASNRFRRIYQQQQAQGELTASEREAGQEAR